ncbi:NERD domain-containing protein [Lederbergia wuyishanensis]|uniref:Recombinational DNA repair protein RecR n=1 Tax=Lederbergia wuyishanensis TaxID=1347903 RepID=A0ABU0D9C0_9BACI|nr:NERD domain-containing protein [Lederbergia wuyishanensis]MCJ8009401.1 NERD domain-containing protein [Lederbergia wuyishanensis]MDQ0344990.1 recombinational DNA repair protein RecR [Lederbergia wuyishanensis]
MAIKKRVESKELKVYRSLNSRQLLTSEKMNQLFNLEKGFEGELLFDELIDALSKEWLVLNELLLESNNTDFQIDSLILAEKTILVIEIKNYEGDYFIEDGKWYYINGTQIQNPVPRLERSEFLLRRLLQDHGYNIPAESYLVYVNPDFHLYNSPRNLPIIYPVQLNRFIDKLRRLPSKTNERHKTLAHKLISLHKEDSPFTRLPEYSYEKLRKGITCASCYSFNIESKKTLVVCKNCRGMENIDTAVLRSVEEFRLLFPDRKITTSDIYDWCKGLKTKETIQKILLKKYIQIGKTKSSYYIKKE